MLIRGLLIYCRRCKYSLQRNNDCNFCCLNSFLVRFKAIYLLLLSPCCFCTTILFEIVFHRARNLRKSWCRARLVVVRVTPRRLSAVPVHRARTYFPRNGVLPQNAPKKCTQNLAHRSISRNIFTTMSYYPKHIYYKLVNHELSHFNKF